MFDSFYWSPCFFCSHVQPLIMFAYSRVGVYLKGLLQSSWARWNIFFLSFSSVYIRLHMHKKGQNEVAGGRFISEKNVWTRIMWRARYKCEWERERSARTHTHAVTGGKIEKSWIFEWALFFVFCSKCVCVRRMWNTIYDVIQVTIRDYAKRFMKTFSGQREFANPSAKSTWIIGT